MGYPDRADTPAVIDILSVDCDPSGFLDILKEIRNTLRPNSYWSDYPSSTPSTPSTFWGDEDQVEDHGEKPEDRKRGQDADSDDDDDEEDDDSSDEEDAFEFDNVPYARRP